MTDKDSILATTAGIGNDSGMGLFRDDSGDRQRLRDGTIPGPGAGTDRVDQDGLRGGLVALNQDGANRHVWVFPRH
jgi:hypothetical protein